MSCQQRSFGKSASRLKGSLRPNEGEIQGSMAGGGAAIGLEFLSSSSHRGLTNEQSPPPVQHTGDARLPVAGKDLISLNPKTLNPKPQTRH